MAEDWNAIAEEVSADIADVGFPVIVYQPSSTNIGTIADPVFADPTPVEVSAVERMIRRRDAEGVILNVVRSLLIPAGAVVPEKGWTMLVGGKKYRINEVYPLAPGGVDLMYRLELDA